MLKSWRKHQRTDFQKQRATLLVSMQEVAKNIQSRPIFEELLFKEESILKKEELDKKEEAYWKK